MFRKTLSLLCIFLFLISCIGVFALAEGSEPEARIARDNEVRIGIVELYRAKKYDEAIVQVEEFLADNPDSPIADKFLKTCIYSYVGKALQLRDSHHREQALKLLDECIDRYQEAPDIQHAIDARNNLRTLIRKETPANGQVFHNNSVVRGGSGTLTINSGDYPLLVKVESTSNKANYINIYVRAKSHATVHIQPGSYIVKYCVGETWYGNGEWFGSDMARYKCDTVLDFANYPYYSTYTLTLYSVIGGNLSSTPLSASDF